MTNGWPQQQQAGWRPDPHAPGRERWWNGAGWTEHVRQAVAPNHPPANQPSQPFSVAPAYGPPVWSAPQAPARPRSFAPWGIALGIAGVLLVAIIAAVVVLGPVVNSAMTTATSQDMVEVEAAIEADILAQSGLTVDVACPTSPSFARGSVFECVGTATDNTRVIIEVRVQDDAGNYIWEVVR